VADAVVSGELTVDSLLADLDPSPAAEAERLMASHKKELDVIAAAQVPPAQRTPQMPEIISATNFVRLSSGDMSVWELARPMPDRPTIQRRVGTEVHRIIEEKTRAMASYPAEEELDEPSEVTDPKVIEALMEHFGGSGYADRTPAMLPSGELMLELPFTLKMEGRIVKGRVDAVYETDDGGIEIVDFKTGSRFEVGEHDQLTIYAQALDANGLLPADKAVLLTYLFLDGEPPLTRMWREGGPAQPSLFGT
jgi:DNA helicase-2/ATP-dependent DNA helicase PcrA